MRKQWIVLFLTAAIMFSISFPLSLTAQEDEGLKERFLKRKPAIDGMKNRGAVGENNRGFLAFRGHVNEQERRIVEEENTDRRTVYTRIAQRHGVPVETVGKRRALKIAQIASPGHWLQDPKGNWYRK